MNRKSAIAAIEKAGILLVFPMDNRPAPASIWSHFFPRKKMKWEWDETGDNAVGDLWHLRSELSTARKVIYTKWFRGRATYFSVTVFAAMVRLLNPLGDDRQSLSINARKILKILEGESPLSTKELKRMADLKGKSNERVYEKAMGELWACLLIVAYGEIDEGAFPSLAVGATRVLFEEVWKNSLKSEVVDAERVLTQELSRDNLFYLYFLKLRKSRISIRKSAKNQASTVPPKVVHYKDLV